MSVKLFDAERFAIQRNCPWHIDFAGVKQRSRPRPPPRPRLAPALTESHPDLASDAADMEAGIGEMGRRIEDYIAFVRDKGAEQARPSNLEQYRLRLTNRAIKLLAKTKG
jgi:hypothetical protein